MTVMAKRGTQATTETVLDVRDLVKHFPLRRGIAFWQQPPAVQAVSGVTFAIRRGTTYGLVGESGSGKSTIARMALLLESLTAGDIRFDGDSITKLHGKALRRYRSRVQAVFQDPSSSFSPRMRVSEIVGELPMLHEGLRGAAQRERVAELLELVGLPSSYSQRFPHEFSGGQRQRLAIARAIATNPDLLVLDEPVSALDVSIRAQVLNLLSDLQQRLGLTYLLIAHDLAIVEQVSDTVGVLYLGKLMEECPSEELSRNPLHPYTKALLSAVPLPDPTRRTAAIPLTGEIPSALNPPSGCRFNTRCPLVMDVCRAAEPPLIEVEPEHRVACHLVTPEPAGGGGTT
jgi:oligopeptide/dipeptide ABC transporter ATP-binding protein